MKPRPQLPTRTRRSTRIINAEARRESIDRIDRAISHLQTAKLDVKRGDRIDSMDALDFASSHIAQAKLAIRNTMPWLTMLGDKP